MAIEDEKDYREPTLAKPEEYKMDQRKSTLAKLEEYVIGVLYSLIERDASTWRFWVKITVVMFLVTGGPAVAIFLYFLGRDHGLFN